MLHAAADALLVVHVLLAAFIVGGLIAVWIGRWRGWGWVRGRRWRALHLIAIGYVALETLLGYACPLTVWEDALRGHTRAASFVGYWLQRLLYYRFPHWVFALGYALWAVATLLTWTWVPPKPRR